MDGPRKGDQKKGSDALKFRPFKRNVDDLLNPDVLDDETRRLLLQNVMHPPPPVMDNAYKRPSRSDVGIDAKGNVQRSASPSKAAVPKQGSPSPPSPSPQSDDAVFPSHLRAKVRAGQDDLVSAMAARLTQTEKTLKVYQSELTEERNKYRILNDKYQKELRHRDETENTIIIIYEEKKELEHELAEIKKFLADYGLEWKGTRTRAGSNASSSSSAAAAAVVATPTSASKGGDAFDLYEGDYANETPRDSSGDKGAPVHFTNTAKKGTQLFSNVTHTERAHTPSAAARDGKASEKAPVNVRLLERNARILSDYVGSGHIVSDGKTAGIRSRDVVRVVVYKNGICVNGGVFRPYGWPLCEAFLQDLAEGYYPYEFKDKYPDGYPIEVIDKSAEECGKPQAAAASGGHRLGGDVLTMDARSAEYQPVSRQEFLNKIPKQHVTASGQLVGLRDGIANMMGGGGQAPPITGTIKHVTAAEREFHDREKVASGPPSLADTQRDGDALALAAKTTEDSHGGGMIVGDLVAILVRLPDGQKTKLHLNRTSTVAELRRELVAAAPQLSKAKFELCQSYPTVILSDHSATLESLGITKTCALNIRMLK